MGGLPSKRPRPSYEDGKVDDPRIEEMQKAAAKDGDDQRSGLMRLIKRAGSRGDRDESHDRKSA